MKISVFFLFFYLVFSLNAFSIDVDETCKNVPLDAVGPQKVCRSDSGITGPTYPAIVEHLKELNKKYPKYTKLINLGKTEAGTEIHGILLADQEKMPETLVVVTGSTHGNEYLALEDRLIDAFLDEMNDEFYDFYSRKGAIFVIPIFNPDGYTKRVRGNSKGIDLNRDFTNVVKNIKRFSQKETQMVDKYLTEFINLTKADFALNMDYHCCYASSLLYPWAFTKDPISQADKEKFVKLGTMMKDQIPKSKYGAVGEILWYTPDGTSMDYWYAKYGTLSVTLEGDYAKENLNLPAHITWWKNVITGL